MIGITGAMSRRQVENCTAHIINHTHWDREWFLTSIYTSQWIPGLMDKLVELVERNPGFHYFLDGQTLVIEDLLEVAPRYGEIVAGLVRDGNVQIGPYYCQPDWRLTCGEALLRNLLLGRQDIQRHQTGSLPAAAGWLVDTFGHISQSPQLHRLFGIDSVYVWRGIPELEPFFQWRGADGSLLFAINLFGGYRNLYGVTYEPELAVKRLVTELQKLKPYYPTPDIPLFDGYDLEDNPEDPVLFYQNTQLPIEIEIREASPAGFAREMSQKINELPLLSGELISGKYGAVFPGTLSSRPYLKVMACDCEHLLYQVCEPLGTLAWLRGRQYPGGLYEKCSRLLLQNAVHDCICGVSIDQVHEKMEHIYRQVFAELLVDLEISLASILGDFAPGAYLVSTNPFSIESWQPAGDQLIHTITEGIGVWQVEEQAPVSDVQEPVGSFEWTNDYYAATVAPDGSVQVGLAVLGKMVVSREKGDAYSDELGEPLGVLVPTSPLTILQKSARHCTIGFSSEWQEGDQRVTAAVRLLFDPSPLIRWEIDLLSCGTDLRLELVFDLAREGEIFAGMPFDLVQRPAFDTDLLPRQVPDELGRVLLGQRELNAISTFPFQDFLSISGKENSVTIFAKGLRAYSAGENGRLKIPLNRAVEWLTKPDLEDRVGDAGPFFYVPDGRGERLVSHELAVGFCPFPAGSLELQALNAAYQNPPLVVQVEGQGERTRWQVFHEELPISSLSRIGEKALVRLYNPTSQPQSLRRPYLQTDVWGRELGTTTAAGPKQIVTAALDTPISEAKSAHKDSASVSCVTPPKWRVGKNRGSPDPEILAGLENRIAMLEGQVSKVEAQMEAVQGKEQLKLLHRYYVLKRERVELEFSLLLNRRKLGSRAPPGREDLFRVDEEIAALGLELNHLRIKRRIFDYVVQAI
jgi:alpha-mannosidase